MLLIVREALWGRTRFAEFRERLGIASDVLTDRLGKLVDNGILERRAYREEGAREREEYLLTDAGRDLMPILAAMVAWGDRHRPTGFGPATVLTDASTGQPVSLEFTTGDGRTLPVEEIALIRGPGALTS